MASNDGNLVVVVSKNSDKWLLDNKTVDKLSEAAQQPLLENPPSWSGAATAMMDQIVKSKKASTSSSTVIVGIIIMGVVLVALVIIIGGHGGDSSAQGDQEGFQGRTPR